jgi:hypothetical protein
MHITTTALSPHHHISTRPPSWGRVVLGALVAISLNAGCGAAAGLLDKGSNKSTDAPTAEAATDCDTELAAFRSSFDEGLAELTAKPAATKSEIKAINKELGALRTDTILGIRKLDGCNEPGEALGDEVRIEAYAYRAILARKALDAGEALTARTLFWEEYNRDDRLDKPEYAQLSRDIGAAYDALKLAQFEQSGAIGQHDDASTMCVFSSEPFPKNPAKVSPIFSSHIDGDKLYVLCRLPNPAESYEVEIEPQLVIMMGIESGGSTFPIVSSALGSPRTYGDARYVRAEFDMPPSREDFDAVERHAFDVYLQHKYNINTGFGLEGRMAVVARAGVFWHR